MSQISTTPETEVKPDPIKERVDNLLRAVKQMDSTEPSEVIDGIIELVEMHTVDPTIEQRARFAHGLVKKVLEKRSAEKAAQPPVPA